MSAQRRHAQSFTSGAASFYRFWHDSLNSLSANGGVQSMVFSGRKSTSERYVTDTPRAHCPVTAKNELRQSPLTREPLSGNLDFSMFIMSFGENPSLS
ncbi:hypothetical protein CLCR_09336 [Cladophialophora carrionii]|uniref:Uncharacterized protein n=1 Tax=Cladophialophora carrionii TaxID=86049 RepID=A0A1C1CTP0_9EURO|nr:hypothetical protein CLCR_09336 [Cladophialophora carrionii]